MPLASIHERDLPERVTVLEERQANYGLRLDRHERNDSDRWTALDMQVTRVHERIDRIGYAAWAAAFSAILTLVATLAQVALRAHQ